MLAFAAFLWYNEMAQLRCCDVTSSDAAMYVPILSSKTDQYRQGDTVLVAHTYSHMCPVSMMEKNFSQAGLSPSSSLLLFRDITRTKLSERL